MTDDPHAGLKSAIVKERELGESFQARIREFEQQAAEGVAQNDTQPDAGDAVARATRRLVAAEFRIAAEGKVKDVRLAEAIADLDNITVDDDWNVDPESLAAAVDALLQEYPDMTPQRFFGTADQGARYKQILPGQLSREDLKNMTPQAILAADRAGRLDRLKRQ